MGTRIHVAVEHQIAKYRDRIGTPQLLAASIPAALAVADYWRSVDPDFTDEVLSEWVPFPTNESFGLLYYRGPGGLHIQFGPRVALIMASGRWRGFLTIEPLRRVHLTAFREIARVFGARRMALFPSEGVADDLDPALTEEGITFDDGIAILERYYGPAQPSVHVIASQIVADAEHCAPDVWFLAMLDD